MPPVHACLGHAHQDVSLHAIFQLKLVSGSIAHTDISASVSSAGCYHVSGLCWLALDPSQVRTDGHGHEHHA